MPLSQEESKKLKKTATAASVALAVSLSLLKMFGALSLHRFAGRALVHD